ncbi:hypothetical protein CP987_19395, partial [Morganella morganii]
RGRHYGMALIRGLFEAWELGVDPSAGGWWWNDAEGGGCPAHHRPCYKVRPGQAREDGITAWH